MFCYNVKINIDADKADEWLKWMKEKHIIDVMKTGYFNSYKIFRLADKTGNEKKIDFLIQYCFGSMENYLNYLENDAKLLQKEHTEKFAGKFTASREIWEEI